MLTREQYAALKVEAEVAGLSLGELVRRALDHVYRPRARLKVRGWEISVAVWRRPDAAVVARRLRARRGKPPLDAGATSEPRGARRRTLV